MQQVDGPDFKSPSPHRPLTVHGASRSHSATRRMKLMTGPVRCGELGQCKPRCGPGLSGTEGGEAAGARFGAIIRPPLASHQCLVHHPLWLLEVPRSKSWRA